MGFDTDFHSTFSQREPREAITTGTNSRESRPLQGPQLPFGCALMKLWKAPYAGFGVPSERRTPKVEPPGGS
jgi:hypothetical protein